MWSQQNLHVQDDWLTKHGVSVVIAGVVPVVHGRHHLVVELHEDPGLMSLPHQAVELVIWSQSWPVTGLSWSTNLEIETSIDGRREDPGVDVHSIPFVGVDLGVAHGAAPALEDLETDVRRESERQVK